jgi:hypothetical protein
MSSSNMTNILAAILEEANSRDPCKFNAASPNPGCRISLFRAAVNRRTRPGRDQKSSGRAAQICHRICDLLNRRIVFGTTSNWQRTQERSKLVRIENPRYSRLQILATSV